MSTSTIGYIDYWAAGRLNLGGGNPYDPNQLLPLQLSTGKSEGVLDMMWNPPWMLTLVMPFGFFSFPTSRTLWLLFSLIIGLIGINAIWSLYGGRSNLRWVSWTIGFNFVPVLEALKKRQSGLLILLGVVGFLYFLKNQNGFLEGMSLSLLMGKPHILYLFSQAVLIWSICRKRWSILLGAVTMLVSATLITWIINPHVLQQYFAIRNHPHEDWATPTLGGLFRLLFGAPKIWLQYLPPAIGFLWFLDHWRRQRNSWEWLDQAPLLILISLATIAYGWTWDLTLAIVLIIQKPSG